ncbi:hypothetical protein ACFXAZ_20420 [Streptomyces sp. NPDC059477]|uniref:hypothetical protein n=1 Tax=Streptomyces sp. NPDC059477 TaxID=3346847 RepID=UPI003677BB72
MVGSRGTALVVVDQAEADAVEQLLDGGQGHDAGEAGGDGAALFGARPVGNFGGVYFAGSSSAASPWAHSRSAEGDRYAMFRSRGVDVNCQNVTVRPLGLGRVAASARA